jgi:hypothetical protein
MAYGVVILANGVRAEDLMDVGLVEVHERVGTPTTYYLRYPVVNAGGELAPLLDARLDPGADLAVFQKAEGFDECLVKGPVFSHQIRLYPGVDNSTLEVVGADATLQMDREVKITQWGDSTSDSDAVSQIVSGYGLTPDAESTNTRHLENNRTLVQHDTDLNFVRMLARRNGYLFWVRCDSTLLETAYFKPPNLQAVNPPIITLNPDDPTVETLDIVWDVETPTSVVALAYDHAAKTNLDGSGVPPPSTLSGDIPLASIRSGTYSTSVTAAVVDVGDLMGRASGVLLESSWFLQASCSVSLRQSGRMIRAHDVVEVQGAGSRYSGQYFVQAVRHVIGVADHRMYLTLIRNGWRE